MEGMPPTPCSIGCLPILMPPAARVPAERCILAWVELVSVRGWHAIKPSSKHARCPIIDTLLELGGGDEVGPRARDEPREQYRPGPRGHGRCWGREDGWVWGYEGRSLRQSSSFSVN